jgi:hypothetical protein
VYACLNRVHHLVDGRADPPIQPADEARYHPTNFDIWLSVVDPDRRLRASGYGGFWNFNRDNGFGGLSASVVDVARILAMLDIRTSTPVLQPAAIANLFTLASSNGGHGFDDGAQITNAMAGEYYGEKGGALPESSQNCARYQIDDYSMVVYWSRHDLGEAQIRDAWWYPDFPAVLDIARTSSWGAGDLFPVFGMPTMLPHRQKPVNTGRSVARYGRPALQSTQRDSGPRCARRGPRACSQRSSTTKSNLLPAEQSRVRAAASPALRDARSSDGRIRR